MTQETSPRRTRFVLAALLASLLVAGFGSFYASTHPDGLERVAEQTGFSDRARDSVAEDGPLAGYETKGVENERVSRAVAGVAGALLVLGLSGGLFLILRRRGA